VLQGSAASCGSHVWIACCNVSTGRQHQVSQPSTSWVAREYTDTLVVYLEPFLVKRLMFAKFWRAVSYASLCSRGMI
jgi:hypothetical protein